MSQEHLTSCLRSIPLAHAAGIVLAAISLIVALDYFSYAGTRKKLGDIPIVGDAPYLLRRLKRTENDTNLASVLQRGYDTFSKKSKPWGYWGQHDDLIIVVPPATCDEIKNTDLAKLNFLKAADDNYHFRLHSKTNGRDHVEAIRQSATKNMNQLHKALVMQSDETIPAVLDVYAKTREPFAAFLTIWHLVNVVSAAYLGPEFPRDSEFMEAIESYSLNMPAFIHLYFWVPSPLRRAFWLLSLQGSRVRETIKKVNRFLVPQIRSSIVTWRKTGRVPNQYSFLGALLAVKHGNGQIKQDPAEMGAGEEQRQVRILSDELRLTAFEVAGPPACLLTQMLFETIEHPDVVQPLRDEIASALAAHGGEWSPEMLSSLPRLESFTRETLRVDGPTLFSVTRSVLQPVQLQSGLALVPGHMITSPAWFIHTDETYYPRAREFDPWRFYDETTNTATAKSTTISNTFLAFGYGSQSCPGRFLGVRIAQILYAKILLRYDVESGEAKTGRPDSVFMPGQLLPPYEAKIVLKEREGV